MRPRKNSATAIPTTTNGVTIRWTFLNRVVGTPFGPQTPRPAWARTGARSSRLRFENTRTTPMLLPVPESTPANFFSSCGSLSCTAIYFWHWGQYTVPRPPTLICTKVVPQNLQGCPLRLYTSK